MDVAARLEAVERENDMLRARIAQLEDALAGSAVALPIEWGLTPQESRVLGVLRARSMATKEAVMAALYVDLGKDEAEPKIVDVFICKIRKKLKPFGVEIKTVWGQGYSLAEKSRAVIKQNELRAA